MLASSTSPIYDKTCFESAPMSPALTAFVQALPHPAYAKNFAGEFIFKNAALQSYCDDVAHASLFETMLTSEDSVLNAEATVRTASMTINDVNVVFASPNAKALHFTFDCMPLYNDEAVMIGTIGMLRDITEQHEQSIELAESHQLMQTVFDHLPIRVFWKDTDLNYLGCNTIFANDMGFEQPELLIGHDDFHTGMTTEEAKLCRGEDFAVLEADEPRLGIEEVIGTGEDQMWIRVSKMPLRSSTNELLGILGMYEDIAEQKQAKIELENALRQERNLSEMKMRFVSTVSHEFRNPLAAIQVNADLLLHLNEEMRSKSVVDKRLKIIVGQIARMQSLMDTILFVGHEDLNEVDTRFEAIDFNRLLAELVDDMGVQDRVAVSISGGDRPIIGMRKHLAQAMRHLLDNALRFSSEVVCVNVNWAADYVDIDVVDKGVGVSAEEVPYVFDSFYRGGNIGQRNGNGLGLYIAKQAVTLHQGKISIDSVVDQGSTVNVRLPLKPQTLG